MAKQPQALTGRLVSKLDKPAYITYGGRAVVVSPRQVIKNVDESRIGNLPAGVFFVKNKNTS